MDFRYDIFVEHSDGAFAWVDSVQNIEPRCHWNGPEPSMCFRSHDRNRSCLRDIDKLGELRFERFCQVGELRFLLFVRAVVTSQGLLVIRRFIKSNHPDESRMHPR